MTRALVCVSLGLVITIAVAWLGVASERQPGTYFEAALVLTTSPSPSPPVRPIESLYPGWSGATWSTEPQRQTARGPIVSRRVFALTGKDPAGSPQAARVEVYRAGWPMKALEWTVAPWSAGGGKGGAAGATKPTLLGGAWEFGINYQGRASGWSRDEWRQLPVRPAHGGLGLAANTAVFGIAAS